MTGNKFLLTTSKVRKGDTDHMFLHRIFHAQYDLKHPNMNYPRYTSNTIVAKQTIGAEMGLFMQSMLTEGLVFEG